MSAYCAKWQISSVENYCGAGYSFSCRLSLIGTNLNCSSRTSTYINSHLSSPILYVTLQALKSTNYQLEYGHVVISSGSSMPIFGINTNEPLTICFKNDVTEYSFAWNFKAVNRQSPIYLESNDVFISQLLKTDYLEIKCPINSTNSVFHCMFNTADFSNALNNASLRIKNAVIDHFVKIETKTSKSLRNTILDKKSKKLSNADINLTMKLAEYFSNECANGKIDFSLNVRKLRKLCIKYNIKWKSNCYIDLCNELLEISNR